MKIAIITLGVVLLICTFWAGFAVGQVRGRITAYMVEKTDESHYKSLYETYYKLNDQGNKDFLKLLDTVQNWKSYAHDLEKAVKILETRNKQRGDKFDVFTEMYGFSSSK